MSGGKIAGKVFMGIDIAVSFIAAAMTYTAAIDNMFFAIITLGLAGVAIICASAGFESEESNLGLLIAGSIISIIGAFAIISALSASAVTLIPWIIFVVGAILFLCH